MSFLKSIKARLFGPESQNDMVDNPTVFIKKEHAELFRGFATECTPHHCRRLQLLQGMAQTLSDIIENMEQPPEPNCSCHLHAPCGDCDEWSGLRELIDSAKEQIKETEDFTQEHTQENAK